MGVLRTLLIIALVYYAIRLISRIFIRSSRSGSRPEAPKRGRNRRGNSGDKLGEYVDYEEVDD